MKRYTILIAIFVLCAIPAQAQFGKLKRAIKTEKPKVTAEDSNKISNAEKKSTESSETSAMNKDGTMKSPAQLGFDPKYPPGFMYSTLLNGIKMRGDGTLYFDDITATFLPPASSPSGRAAYNYDDGGKLTSIIRRKDGTVIDERFWNGRKADGPLWIVHTYELSGRQSGSIKMSPGDYTLEFYVEGKPFYRLPFSVEKEGATTDDPFAKGAGEKIILKSPWDKYGYLFLSGANPGSNLVFKTWLRLPVKKNNIDFSIELREKNGKVIGSNGKSKTTIGLLPVWERREFRFYKQGGSQLSGSDILSKDGDYEIRLSIEGQHYGTYPFSVREGKFVYLPEQTRGEENFMTMIEGGNDAWFVKKSD